MNQAVKQNISSEASFEESVKMNTSMTVLPTQWVPIEVTSVSSNKSLSTLDSSIEDNIDWNSLLLKWHNQLCVKEPSACTKNEFGLFYAAKFVVEELERSHYQQAINDSMTGIVNATTDHIEMNATIANTTSFSDDLDVLQYAKSQYSIYQIVILAIIMTAMMIVIVVGNILVVIATATENNLASVQNWFIASLAIADMLIGLVIMPFSLSNELMGYWMFGKLWCDVHSALDVLCSTASIMNICLISLDRYWSITKAIAYLNTRTPKIVILMISTTWALSSFISIPPLLGWKDDIDMSNFTEILNSQGNLTHILFLKDVKDSGLMTLRNFTDTLETIVYPQCSVSNFFYNIYNGAQIIRANYSM